MLRSEKWFKDAKSYKEAATTHAEQRKAEVLVRQANGWLRFFREAQRKYNISEEQYWKMYEAQGGVCFICRKAGGRARRLGIDHNHVTGRVRGLLCTGSEDPKTCNRLIAYYTPEALARAVEYMSSPPAFKVLK